MASVTTNEELGCGEDLLAPSLRELPSGVGVVDPVLDAFGSTAWATDFQLSADAGLPFQGDWLYTNSVAAGFGFITAHAPAAEGDHEGELYLGQSEMKFGACSDNTI
jgi:hypothetical protein